MHGRAPVPTTMPTPAWRYGAALIGLAWGLQAYAIWSNEYLPLVDLPNHMARHYLEAVKLAGGDTGPYYDIEYRLLPNLGADLVLPWLILALGPYVACKLFLSLAVFLYWLGPAWFIAQQGAYRPSAVAAALLLLPFSFSGQFYWGFLNYYSGFGLAFLVLVHFTCLLRQDRLRLGHLILHAFLVTLLFIWHLAPWTIYCVIMGCFVVSDSWQRYRRGLDRLATLLSRASLFLAPVFPGLLLLTYYSASSESGVDPTVAYIWGGWLRKVTLPGSLFRSYDRWIDLAVTALWISGSVMWFGKSLLRWRWSSLHLCLAALTVFYFLMPFQLGGTSDSDGRVLPSILVCTVALATFGTVKHWRWGSVLLGLGIVLRFTSIASTWHGFSEEMATHATAFESIEPHSRIMPVTLWPAPSKDYPERHFPAWIVLSKNVFVPIPLSGADQFTLRLLRPAPLYLRRHASGFEIVDGTIRDHYDYVWLYNPAGQAVRVPPSFERIFSATHVTVWRIGASERVSALSSP
jgi:hypothetical protein